MKPFNDEDLAALVQHRLYRTALGKAFEMVAKLGKVERSDMGYVLVKRDVFSGFSIYLGIRYDTDWYFDIDLLNGGPELIAYLKDDETDSVKADGVSS